ncbi:MAG: hypothetical protein D6706_21810, partial [Chloroflexi bacterium]
MGVKAVIVVLALLLWWRDVVIEATYEGAHTTVVTYLHRTGMIFFIVSEVMFFVAFFWGFFHSSLSPSIFIGAVWPPRGVEVFEAWEVPFLNTLILLTSGAGVTAAHAVIVHGIDWSNMLRARPLGSNVGYFVPKRLLNRGGALLYHFGYGLPSKQSVASGISGGGVFGAFGVRKTIIDRLCAIWLVANVCGQVVSQGLAEPLLPRAINRPGLQAAMLSLYWYVITVAEAHFLVLACEFYNKALPVGSRQPVTALDEVLTHPVRLSIRMLDTLGKSALPLGKLLTDAFMHRWVRIERLCVPLLYYRRPHAVLGRAIGFLASELPYTIGRYFGHAVCT